MKDLEKAAWLRGVCYEPKMLEDSVFNYFLGIWLQYTAVLNDVFKYPD